MTSIRVSSKGQITLPIDARRKLGIEPNTRVEVVVRDEDIVIKPMKTIDELDGILHTYLKGRKRLSWEEERQQMERAIAQEAQDG